MLLPGRLWACWPAHHRGAALTGARSSYALWFLEACEYKWADSALEPRVRFCSASPPFQRHREPAGNTPQNLVLKLVCIVSKQFSLLMWEITAYLACFKKGFSIFWVMDPKKRSSESIRDSHSVEWENLLFLNPFKAREKPQKVHRSQIKNYLHKAKDKKNLIPDNLLLFFPFTTLKCSHSLTGVNDTGNRTPQITQISVGIQTKH